MYNDLLVLVDFYVEVTELLNAQPVIEFLHQ